MLRSKRLWRHTEPAFERAMEGSGLRVAKEKGNFANRKFRLAPWDEGDFEEQMAMLLHWANTLNRSDPAFAQALNLLQGEDSLIGRVIRRTKAR